LWIDRKAVTVCGPSGRFILRIDRRRYEDHVLRRDFGVPVIGSFVQNFSADKSAGAVFLLCQIDEARFDVRSPDVREQIATNAGQEIQAVVVGDLNGFDYHARDVDPILGWESSEELM